MSVRQDYLEHPEDVLGRWLDWRAEGPAALIVITATEGGAVRDRGALMAVSADGRAAGYISGGCIDADVILQAGNALRSGETKQLRYGAGSPFADLPLPCGGAIEVCIIPDADEAMLRACHEALAARRPARLCLPDAGIDARYVPRLRIRIAGRGADPLALARLARAGGIDTVLHLRDGEDVAAARAAGFASAAGLDTPSDLPAMTDDPWTAFILMFHDNDWEGPLLRQALDGPAFYAGAVGSLRTHARRCEALRASGVAEADIARIHGPVGLISSMRDASMLAVSTLAEIVAAYHETAKAPFARTGLVLLAAGGSTRFTDGDKLLASFGDHPVMTHAANVLGDEPVAARIAVTRPGALKRAALLGSRWQVAENPDADSGQASSLKAGLTALAGREDIDQVIILLADMPAVPERHLRRLQQLASTGASAVMTESAGRLMPPALFRRDQFSALMAITGDRGAKAVFQTLEGTATAALDAALAFDIDTTDDLNTAEEALHA